MEINIDVAGHVTGTAASQFEPSPAGRPGTSVSGGMQLNLDTARRSVRWLQRPATARAG